MNGLTTVAPLGAHPALPAAGQGPLEEREIRFLGDLQRLQPQPGDVFVLTCTQALSADQCEHLAAYWKRVMGDTKLLVLCDGLKLGCIAAPATRVANGEVDPEEVRKHFGGCGAGSGD